MRLICTIEPNKTKQNPFELSFFLTKEGIDNECEEIKEDGHPSYRIWVYDEDMVDKALEIYEKYRANPTDPTYRSQMQRATQAVEIKEEEEAPPPRRQHFLSASPYGPISILTLVIVIGLFFWSQLGRGDTATSPPIPGIIAAPILAPIERALIFDYPTYFILRDQLLTLYTAKDIEDKTPPSAQAQTLMTQIKQTPVWMGFYDKMVFYFKGVTPTTPPSGPLFSDIAKGEIWRLFTPSILHYDFLHIFFNVLWFILLGNQIEHRIKSLRFLSMILILGVCTNIAQYLVSGPFFMGLSGIVCGMAAFIWARQQIAPWEGYLLHRFTLIFLAIFVTGMFLLQVIFFFTQIFGNFELNVGIANTAHIMGAVIGYLLGRMRRTFALQDKGPLK